MNNLDILNYWKNVNVKMNDFTKISQGSIYKSEKKDVSNILNRLYSFTGKKKLQEFVLILSYFFTSYLYTDKETNYVYLSINTDSSSTKKYPLIFTLQKNRSVKDNINALYEEYKKLYIAATNMSSELEKFLSEDEKEVFNSKYRFNFSFEDHTNEYIHGMNINNNTLYIYYEASNEIQDAKSYYDNFFESFVYIIEELINALSDDLLLSDVSLISPEELQKILVFGKGKIKEIFSESIFDKFEFSVRNYPEKIAVRCGIDKLCYKEFNDFVFKISNLLLGYGLNKGDRVCVHCTNSILVPVTIFSLWNIDAVYIPVSENFSNTKINEIIAESNSKLVISFSNISDLSVPVLNINLESLKNSKNDFIGLQSYENDKDLHMIFTSGTTGKPKAVMIKENGFKNLCQWYINEYSICENSSILLLTNYSFDASMKNLVAPFITGGSLSIINTSLYDLSEIIKTIKENQITHINCVPSLFDQILFLCKEEKYQSLKSLEWVILGGEKINFSYLYDFIQNTDCRISNVYGPTEAYDLSTYHNLTLDDISKKNGIIGQPLDNKIIYILDDRNQICPLYKKGEICISGTGVISSYENIFKSPDCFIKDSYNEDNSLYKTGDIGYWTKDGKIVYCGRKDNQVKINGQRVNLEAYESVGNSIPGILRCAAILYETQNQLSQLVLVYSKDEYFSFDKDLLKEEFSKNFSNSLMPSNFIEVENIPSSQNGKTDYKSLKKIVHQTLECTEIIIPENDVEQRIYDIWTSLLGYDNISTDVSFFEAGGNSLMLNRLKIEIDKIYPNIFSIVDFFEFTTIKKISNRIFLEEKVHVF